MSVEGNRAFRLGAGEGRRIWAFGDLMILKLTGRPRLGRGRVGLDKERSRKVSWASL